MEFSFLFLGFVYFETRGYLGDIYFYPIILLVKPIKRQGYSNRRGASEYSNFAGNFGSRQGAFAIEGKQAAS